ncbi:MAG TPA: winged helix-turn-helix domain-containing protein [Rhizomicrobium sp.]|jgi:DNA-binding transcriptional ArsR family regulator|nr:winged helix-turn-helix domain-containing protein [Rhizomicrobium sp.]
MRDGPVIASVAALLGDPARANMMTALMDGRALTASELAQGAGVTLQTTSGHLSKLLGANLLKVEKQGRHRYFRLSGADVAQVLEQLMTLAQRTGAVRMRPGPRDASLRFARICYDHMAGELAVALMRNLLQRRILAAGSEVRMTAKGARFFSHIGIDIVPLEQGRRRLCRTCLDWSERKVHLGGALGAAILGQVIAKRWARLGDGRVVQFSKPGLQTFSAAFEIH